MKIDEIELIGAQDFSKHTVERYLDLASPQGTMDQFVVNYAEFPAGDVIQTAVILTDDHNQVAAYAGFVSRLNGRVWQARNAQTYDPYQGQALIGKLYQHIKQQWHKSIQSDDVQTAAGRRLWTKTLPSLGLKPMIFDTETEQIMDPAAVSVDIYPSPESLDVARYIWILEKFDRYPEQNLLVEGSLLMPLTGLWYNFKAEK
jgi:hypothetical protein